MVFRKLAVQSGFGSLSGPLLAILLRETIVTDVHVPRAPAGELRRWGILRRSRASSEADPVLAPEVAELVAPTVI